MAGGIAGAHISAAVFPPQSSRPPGGAAEPPADRSRLTSSICCEGTWLIIDLFLPTVSVLSLPSLLTCHSVALSHCHSDGDKLESEASNWKLACGSLASVCCVPACISCGCDDSLQQNWECIHCGRWRLKSVTQSIFIDADLWSTRCFQINSLKNMQ